MIITTKFSYDLNPATQDRPCLPPEIPTILAVEGDTEVHKVEISLYNAGEVWPVPADATVLIGYAKGDGTGGTYDSLPDGSLAWQTGENRVTVTLVGQLLATAGPVWLSVALLRGKQKLNIFQKVFQVRPDPSSNLSMPQDYVSLHDWLISHVPQIVQETGASPESIMSQAAVTQAIGALSEEIGTLRQEVSQQLPEIVQQTGSSVEAVMSQAAVTQAVETLSRQIDALDPRLPAYWQNYLPAKIRQIQELQRSGGVNCISFPVLTDLHICATSPRWCGLLAKAVMSACSMPYALCLGDVADVEPSASKAEALENLHNALQVLGCIRGRLLQTQGDFDVSWGLVDLNNDGTPERFSYNLPPETVHDMIYRPMSTMPGVHFDAKGCGYYVDDTANRVRYILLNSHCNTYQEVQNGLVTRNALLYFRFGQSQCDFLVNALSSVPGDDWSVITASHVPISNDYASYFGGNGGEHLLMQSILSAYKTKTACSATFAGTYTDDAVTVHADFSSAKGSYIAHFGGHKHMDSISQPEGFPIIATRCDGIQESNASLRNERKLGTVTEHSFVVYTVNRKTRTIYATRIGAGTDYQISY